MTITKSKPVTQTGRIRSVAGYEGLYSVSDNGGVFSHSKWVTEGHWLKLRPNHSGYLRVNLHRLARQKDAYVHRLVATAFIPNPHGLPHVNHLNGDKTDNRVANLEWSSCADNTKHAIENGLWKNPKGATHHWARVPDATVVNIYHCRGAGSQESIVKAFGVTRTYVHAVWHRKVRKDLLATSGKDAA